MTIPELGPKAKKNKQRIIESDSSGGSQEETGAELEGDSE